MKTTKSRIFCIAVVLVAFVAQAHADRVELTNGDRISGKLVSLDAGKLVLSTDFAGEITIEADKVNRLVTDEPVTATLLDGTSRKATEFFRDTPAGAPPPAADETEPARLADLESVYAEPKPRIRIKSRANAGLTNQRGNTVTDTYRLDAEAVARTEKQRFTIGGEYNREDADSTRTADNWNAYGNYDYFVLPKWFLYGSSLFESDKFADLNLRTTLGAGAGYQFFESDELNLSLSGGVAYIFENYDTAADEDFPGGQWLMQYDQYFFNKRVQLFHKNRGYISLENGNDWKIDTSQGLRIPLVKGLVSTIQYDYDYNHNPSPDAVSNWDSRLMFLLGYEFKN